MENQTIELKQVHCHTQSNLVGYETITRYVDRRGNVYVGHFSGRSAPAFPYGSFKEIDLSEFPEIKRKTYDERKTKEGKPFYLVHQTDKHNFFQTFGGGDANLFNILPREGEGVTYPTAGYTSAAYILSVKGYKNIHPRAVFCMFPENFNNLDEYKGSSIWIADQSYKKL